MTNKLDVISDDGKWLTYVEGYGYMPSVYGGAGEDDDDDKTNDADQIEKVQAYIKDQVKTHFDALSANQDDPKPDVTQQTPQDDPNAQLREIINPFIEPGLQQAQFTGADAKDYVEFYTGNTEASEYKEKIESTFAALAKAGRATTRKDIHKYILGQEFSADRDKFMDKQSKRKQEQLDRASNASDFGAAGMSRGKDDPSWTNFDTLSLEDMEKKLEGVTF